MTDAFNYLNKVNKRIAAIIEFGGTVSNPLLTPYTQALRELNLKYKWDKEAGSIKMSLGKENQERVEALQKKLDEKHATTYREYKKNFRNRIEQERGEKLSPEELKHELKAQRALWDLNDNLQVFYNFERSGEPYPPELEPYAHLIDEMKGSSNRELREDKERMKNLAIQLSDAVADFRESERNRGLNSVKRGNAL